MNITNELVTEYINGFYRPMTSELGELRDEAEAAKVPIILRETESFLNFITATVRPRKILEIGTAVGYSAQVFAMCGAEVVTIEKDEKMAQTAAHNIEKSPFCNIFLDGIFISTLVSNVGYNKQKSSGTARAKVTFLPAEPKNHFSYTSLR